MDGVIYPTASFVQIGVRLALMCDSDYDKRPNTFPIFQCQANGIWDQQPYGNCQPRQSTTTQTPAIVHQVRDLGDASANGNVEIVSSLLNENNSIVNMVDPQFYLDTEQCLNVQNATALIRASACNQSSDIVKILIQYGADLDRSDADGWTALMFYTYSQNLDVIRLLVENGANLEIRVKHGLSKDLTALEIAVKYRKFSAAIILLQYGADVTNCKEPICTINFSTLAFPTTILATTTAEMTTTTTTLPTTTTTPEVVEQWVFEHRQRDFGQLASESNIELMSEMLDADLVEVNWVDAYYYPSSQNCTSVKNATALVRAVACNATIETIQLLIDHGANVNASDKQGWSALMHAAFQGNTELVRILTESDADIEAKSPMGYNVLILAMASSQSDLLIDFLLNSGADPAMCLHPLCIRKRIELWKLQTTTTAPTTRRMTTTTTMTTKSNEMLQIEFGYAVANGEFNLVQQLLRTNRIDVHFTDYRISFCRIEELEKSPALVVAAACNQSAQILRLLLDAGANVAGVDDWGWSALIWAANRGNVDSVRLLIDRGVPIDYAAPFDGITALITAAANGNSETVRLLVNRGARVELRMKNGANALIEAAKRNHAETVDVLITNGGADVNARDETSGYSAVTWAASRGHIETVRLLISRGVDLTGCTIPLCFDF